MVIVIVVIVVMGERGVGEPKKDGSPKTNQGQSPQYIYINNINVLGWC
jgi:hypothetical protein